ncbi:hypothetical protein D3C85_1648750 [compost metagenome]
MSLVPLLGTVGVLLLAWIYPIDPAMHRRLLDALNLRGRKADASQDEPATPALSRA